MRKLNIEVWPYQVTTCTDGQQEDNWCKLCIGIRSTDWYSYDVDSYRRLYAFKDSESVLMFRLAFDYKE